MSRKEQPAQESSMAETSYSDDERKLVAFVEQVTGGRVTAMRRQPRWRPAWFVDVERDGLLLPIHIRGDRKSDIMPFPELAREAAIMEVLEEHGIPVPPIYGVCPDPEIGRASCRERVCQYV